MTYLEVDQDYFYPLSQYDLHSVALLFEGNANKFALSGMLPYNCAKQNSFYHEP